MNIYCAHPFTREYVGQSLADTDPLEPENWLIPAHAYLDPPPAPVAGQAVVRSEDGAAWQLVADYRGTVYDTTTGNPQQYEDLGDLPGNLTAEARPSPFHVWASEGWVLDSYAQSLAESVAERAWRDSCLANTDYLAMPDYPLTDAARAEVIAYRQALRDWPEGGEFPLPEHRPVPPTWLAERTQ